MYATYTIRYLIVRYLIVRYLIVRYLIVITLVGSFILVGAAIANRPVSAMPLVQEGATPAAVLLPIPFRHAQSVSTGDWHTCALTSGGGVHCWGRNDTGQLGNGSIVSSLTPVAVTGLGSGVAALSSGGTHTCALTGEGGVRCWGDNRYGQLGNGTTTDSSTPVPVQGLDSGIVAISSGNDHTCALAASGKVSCWGRNDGGQVGDGTTIDRTVPEQVIGLESGATAIGSGYSHSCAVTPTARVRCWGRNDVGKLGDGTTDDSAIPREVPGLSDAAGVSAGYIHTCVLTTGGGVKCWGGNSAGQLGNGTTTNSRFPVHVNGLGGGILALSRSDWHTCALTSGGSAFCWGRNENGELGDGTNTNRAAPVVVSTLSNGVTAISAGYQHSCAVTVGGDLKCWGINEFGQLGDTTTINRTLPGDVLTVAYCYALTLAHSGNGADPSATPGHSPGCPPHHYVPGTVVAAVAAPAAGHYVRAWDGANNNSVRDPANLVTIGDADHTVRVAYAPCRPLTLARNGEGALPVAVPASSAGCASHSYAAGDVITLVAAPGAEQRVQSWEGATQTPAAGVVVNTLTLADAANSVTVTYEPCFALTIAMLGQGEALRAGPSATFGCDPGSFVEGQVVTLLAEPASGWQVASWSGTDNDAATGPTNRVTIPSGPVHVRVTYVRRDDPGGPGEGAARLFLPNVQRPSSR